MCIEIQYDHSVKHEAYKNTYNIHTEWLHTTTTKTTLQEKDKVQTWLAACTGSYGPRCSRQRCGQRQRIHHRSIALHNGLTRSTAGKSRQRHKPTPNMRYVDADILASASIRINTNTRHRWCISSLTSNSILYSLKTTNIARAPSL